MPIKLYSSGRRQECWLFSGFLFFIVTGEPQLRKCPPMTSRQACSAFPWLTFEMEGHSLLRTTSLLGRQKALTVVREHNQEARGSRPVSSVYVRLQSQFLPLGACLCMFLCSYVPQWSRHLGYISQTNPLPKLTLSITAIETN